MALGTFSVEYHSANVLFDTRATHSFVTASWVETHNIPVAPMYPPMRVISIGGRTQTDRFCPSARVQIGGIEFPADLIVMGNRDATIDVILGMNWLTKYQASLSCDKSLQSVRTRIGGTQEADRRTIRERLHQTMYLTLGSPSAICGEEGWYK